MLNRVFELASYDWPGNVHELEHLIGRSALKVLAAQRERPRILTLHAADFSLSHDTATSSGDAAPAATPASAPGVNLRDAVTAYERSLILDALACHEQNWASTAPI